MNPYDRFPRMPSALSQLLNNAATHGKGDLRQTALALAACGVDSPVAMAQVLIKAEYEQFVRAEEEKLQKVQEALSLANHELAALQQKCSDTRLALKIQENTSYAAQSLAHQLNGVKTEKRAEVIKAFFDKHCTTAEASTT